MSEQHLRPQQDEKGRFLPGNSGFGGRPKGSRNKLGEDFIRDLQAAWEAKGVSVIDRVIEEKPADFLKVVASLLPKEFNLNANIFSDLGEDELGAILSALQSLQAERIRADAGSGDQEAARH